MPTPQSQKEIIADNLTKAELKNLLKLAKSEIKEWQRVEKEIIKRIKLL
jgi:hypothetical protein